MPCPLVELKNVCIVVDVMSPPVHEEAASSSVPADELLSGWKETDEEEA